MSHRLLPVKLEVRYLPRNLRTQAQIAKRFYHSASRTKPLRRRNAFLAGVGAHTDLRLYFADDARHLVIVVPEVEVTVS